MSNPYQEEEEDPWPDEPAEFDPESLGPSVRIPEAPQVRDYSQVDVPDGLFRAFWEVVLMINVGLFGVSIGAMFITFRGNWELGGTAFAVGCVALLLGYRRYVVYQHDQERDDGGSD